MKRITSRQNPLVAKFRSVARGSETGMLLEGPHLISEALAARVTIRHAMVSTTALDRPEIWRLVAALEAAGAELSSVPGPVMAAVSQVNSSSFVVAIGDQPSIELSRMYSGTPLVTIAFDVQDPGNVGAIVRAVEAAGGTGVVTAGRTANPFGPKALRGSMGSALRLPVAIGDASEAVAAARSHRCRILAAVPRGGRSLFDLTLTAGAAVLIGGEGGGLPASLVDAADERFTIPMETPVESLNAAIAAAVVAYEARRQRTAPRLAGRQRASGG